MEPTDYSTNPFSQPSAPPIEYIRVGFGKRFVAYLIDGLILTTVMVGLGLLFMGLDLQNLGFVQEKVDQVLEIYKMLGVPRDLQSFVDSFLGAIITSGLVVGTLYPLIEGITGASPGKRILRIVIANPDGKVGSLPLFLKRAAIKNIGSILQLIAVLPALAFFETIGSIVGIVIFLGCFAALGASRLALHDLIAQTAVFHVEDVHS